MSSTSVLSARDLAELLGVSRATIYRYRSEGKDHLLPPAIMIGVQPRWRMSTVQSWLEEQEGKANAHR